MAYDTSGVLGAHESVLTSSYPSIFTCKTLLFQVEPMGLEPTPSAVQNRGSNITRVCRRLKTCAKRRILCATIWRLFAAVRAG